jgi:hypothetical protein
MFTRSKRTGENRPDKIAIRFRELWALFQLLHTIMNLINLLSLFYSER